ncbi:MAG: hypothetical protein OEY49_20460, partial [Candidatus Heimdallarchaeota archaeon]|nr:hypothetical protein [Candidatus Heimdallarchaeota archaeon]
MNRVELAKSSRSSCKLCKEKIEKTNPRVGIEKEITMSGKTFTSMGWHHVDCIIDKMPDELITIEFGENIPDEIIQKINKEIEKLNKSNFSIKVFTDILEENQIINVKGTVLRALKPSEQELPDGNVKEARTIWVEDSENKKRGKFILWGTHSTTNPTSGDIILLLNGLSVLAENDEIQYHATDKSTILINPSDDDMQNNVIEVKYYTS